MCLLYGNTLLKSFANSKSHVKGKFSTVEHFLWMFVTIHSLPNDIILGMSKFEASADDKFSVTEIMGFVFERVENIVGKGENAGYQHFLVFPTMFSKGFLPCLVNS